MGVLGWIAEKFSEQTGIEIPDELVEGADEMTGLDESLDEGLGEIPEA